MCLGANQRRLEERNAATAINVAVTLSETVTVRDSDGKVVTASVQSMSRGK